MNFVKKTSSTSINSLKQGHVVVSHHNNSRGADIKSEKLVKEQSSVRFQKVFCESPEVSVLSNASHFII